MRVVILRKNKLFFLLFDTSLLFYLIAYYVYYQDITPYASTVRLFATAFIFISGCMLCINKRPVLDCYIVTYGLFFIFGMLSMLWSKDDSLIISVVPSIIRNIMVLYFVSVRVKEQEDIERILIIHILAIIFLDIFVMKLMINYYSLSTFFLKRFGDNFAYNSNAISTLNALSALFSIYFARKCEKKILPVVTLCFFTFIIVICGSKQGMITLIMGILLTLYLKGSLQKKIGTIIIAIAVVVIVWKLIMNVSILYEIIGYRFEGLLGLVNSATEDVSTLNRNNLLKQAFEVWVSHPVLGVGFNNFPVVQTIQSGYYYAHNNYLEILADLGVVGFLLYYINYVRIIRFKINKNNPLQVCLKSVFFMLAFMDLTVVSYQDLRHQLPLYLIFLGLGKLNSNKNNLGFVR